MSAFSVVGIDLVAVLRVAEVFGVEADPDFIRKIKALELYELQRLRGEASDQ